MPGPRGAVSKPKNARAAWQKLLTSIKPYYPAIVISILFSITASILSVVVPRLMGDITTIASETVATGLDWNAIREKAVITIIVLLFSSLTSYIEALILVQVTGNYTARLRSEIIEKISRLPISYFDQHKYGDTLSRMTNDVDILTDSLYQEIVSLSNNLTTLVGILIFMFSISAPLTLIALIVIPISGFAVFKITKFAQKYFRSQRTLLGTINSEIEEDYSGQLIIQINSHESESLANFKSTNQKLTRATFLSQAFSSLAFPVTSLFTNISYVAVAIIGGNFAIQKIIAIGDLQAFIQYTSRFNRPITEIASTTTTIQQLLAAAERIFDFLAEKEESADPVPAEKIKNLKGAVEFSHVDFSYDHKNPIIKDFSVSVRPGAKIAIVGPTGAGKTTMINLLMRFYDPDSGTISIDGVNTQKMSRADVRSLFGMVLQDTWLFSGTIEENLRYGNRSASHDEIRAAAKSANIDHTIESLPDGYKTKINEDSDNISAGEKQLLTIARALVANPPMIILDEATSNVDTRTERLIQDAFEKLTAGRTSFVIAHRLSTIRNSDLIIVMKNGSIVETGNHSELLAKNGFYAELYNSQFADS